MSARPEMTRHLSRLFVCLMLLSGCSSLATGAVKAAFGGGPSVATNVQAGKTNAQTLGRTDIKDQRLDNVTADSVTQSADSSQVKAETVERVVVQQAVPAWIWITWALAWVLDSPMRWPGQIRDGFKRARNRKLSRQEIAG